MHRRLERLTIPSRIRRSLLRSKTRSPHLRPVFRDNEEMVGAGVLDARLREAIDRSSSMVLLASLASSQSTYVNLEVDYFISTQGFERLAIVALGEGGAFTPPLPASLRNSDEDPLWIDCRDDRRLNRRSLVRIASAVLGVDFDLLWERHRRRRRKVLTSWFAFVLLVTAIVGATLRQQNLAEQRTPERQVATFRAWYDAKIGDLGGNPVFTISRTEDLDNDGLLDYFVDNKSPGFCGSGGCATEVYVTDSLGEYREVLSGIGESTPRTRTTPTGQKEIVTTEMSVSREPIYSVHSLTGKKYESTRYEFCDGVFFEQCTPTFIDPLPPGRQFKVSSNAVIRERPDPASRPITVGAGDMDNNFSAAQATVNGMLPDHQWYLVDQWKGSAGFVQAAEIHQ